MYSLIKLLNTDLIKEIYHFNNYSKVDLEWFEYEHKERFCKVLTELEHHFLRPKLQRTLFNHMLESIIAEVGDIDDELLEFYNYNYNYVETAVEMRPDDASIEMAEYLRT